MKHVDKKLVGITAVGLSAWILVIALVVINKNTTIAMFTAAPTPAEQTTPQTLGTTTLAHGELHTSPVSQTSASSKMPSVLPVVLIVGSVLVGASAVITVFALRKRSAKT